MKFWEAMKALDERKKVRIPSWQEHEYINFLKPCTKLFDEDRRPCSFDEEWLSEKWELYEELVQLHTFQEILQWAKENPRKLFRRKSWEDLHYSYFYCDQWNTLRSFKDLKDIACLLLEDIEAEDWIICEKD